MLDIKLIRENPEKINELLKRRNKELSIDEILAVDEERRQIQTKADELRAKRKNESQKIGIMKKNGENTDAIQENERKIGDEIKVLEEKQVELDEKQRDLLAFVFYILKLFLVCLRCDHERYHCKNWHRNILFY